MDVEIKSHLDLSKRPSYVESLNFSEGSGLFIEKMLADYFFPAEHKIACGIEGCRTPHMKGYLVLATNGQETNIGNVCGKKHLGVNFTEKRNQFSDARRRKRNIEQVLEIKENASQHRDAVADIISRAKRLNKLKIFLQKKHGGLSRHLSDRAKLDQVAISGRVNLSEAEAKREYFHSPGRYATFEDYFKTRPKKDAVLVAILGLGFFKHDINSVVQQKIATPWVSLNKLTRDQVQELSDKALRELSDWSSVISKHMEDAIALIKSGEAFFSGANLRSMKYLSIENPSLGNLEDVIADLEDQARQC